MPPRSTLKGTLAHLHGLVDDATSPETVEAVTRSLGSKRSFVMAKAAEIVEAQALEGFTPPLLIDAFGRFMHDPVRTDKGGNAKTAVVEALDHDDHVAHDAIAPLGIHHYDETIRNRVFEATRGTPLETVTRETFVGHADEGADA